MAVYVEKVSEFLYYQFKKTIKSALCLAGQNTGVQEILSRMSFSLSGWLNPDMTGYLFDDPPTGISRQNPASISSGL